MDGKIEYRTYTLSVRQRAMYMIVGAIGFAAIVAVFYRNLILLGVAGIAGSFLFPALRKKQLLEQRQMQLRNEFKEALYSLIVALRAGRSLEGAFEAALEDMDPIMTPHVWKEWQDIVKELQIGFPVEECLEDFATRSGIEEIRSFARTIEVSKRSEGDVVRVMENTVQLLQDRLEVQLELRVLLAKKKTEQRILNIMPLFVIGLLMLMSPDYLAPLYQSLQGAIIMSVCLGLTVLSYFLSKKISEIAL